MCDEVVLPAACEAREGHSPVEEGEDVGVRVGEAEYLVVGDCRCRWWAGDGAGGESAHEGVVVAFDENDSVWV